MQPHHLAVASTVSVFLAAAGLLVGPGAASAAASAPSPATADGPWLERAPYEMPFANRAEWLEFMSQGGTVETEPLAAAYPEEEFAGFVRGKTATVERVSFRSGELTLRGILVQPAGAGPFPAVVYARGGNREYGQLRFLDVVRMLAIAEGEGGRVVLAPEYRGEGGSDGEPELGKGDVDDVMAAVEALSAWPRADTRSLALVGSSRGGLVAAWALTRTELFDAAVLIAPSLDLEASAERRPELDAAVYAKSVAGYAEDRSAALRRASPIHAVGEMAETPILLLHGAADRRVHPTVSLELSRRLLERDRSHRLVIVEGGDHSLTDHALLIRQQIDFWLSTYLPKLEARS